VLPNAHGNLTVGGGAALSSHQRDLAVGRVPDGAISGLSDGRLNWTRSSVNVAELGSPSRWPARPQRDRVESASRATAPASYRCLGAGNTTAPACSLLRAPFRERLGRAQPFLDL